MLELFREINRLMDKPRCKMTYREYCYLRYSLFLICFIAGVVVLGFSVFVMELRGFF